MLTKKNKPSITPIKKTEKSESDIKVNSIKPATARFPIVGIGASAGGLAAFEAFFRAIPADTDMDMAFLLVQHLAACTQEHSL